MTKALSIGFAGLSSASIIAAAVAAENGALVIAFDDDIALTAALRRGEAPSPAAADLVELLARSRDRINYTATAADLSQCAIIYLFVDAVADEKGHRDPAQLKALLRDVIAAARSDAVLVLIGDVPPGYTRAQAPKGRLVFYQTQPSAASLPADALQPKWLIIGCADPSAPLPMPLAAYLATFECQVIPVRYESAELARVAVELICASSIGTTAFLAELCEKAGADWAEIAPVLAVDHRTTSACHIPLGASDDSVDRDLTAILKLATDHKMDGGVIEAFLANRRRRRDWVLQQLEEHVLSKSPDARLAFLGLDDAALALLAALPKLKVRVYDPEMSGDTPRPGDIELASSALEACAGADAVVIFANRQSLADLDPAALAETMRGKMVIDPYRVIDPATIEAAGLSYRGLGRAP